MAESRTISVYIERPAAAVYSFISDPRNLPLWSLFIHSVVPDGTNWRIMTEVGSALVQFVSRNEFGVVDHWVRITPEIEIYVPLRVISNDGGSEVLFTVFRLPKMDEAAFEADVALVKKDLDHLKKVMESNES